MAASNQPNEPINMGPWLGEGGKVMENPDPILPKSRATVVPFTVQKVASEEPAPSPPPKDEAPTGQGFDEGAIKQVHSEGKTAKQGFESGEVGGPAASRWDQLIASVKQTSQAGWIGFHPEYPGSLARAGLESAVEGVQSRAGIEKLTPDQIREQYPEMPGNFSKEPMYPEVAKLRYEAHMRRQQLEAWASLGGPTPWYTNVAAGAAGMIDPGNVAMMAATGGLGRAAGWATKGIAGLRNAFIANTAINAAQEIPNFIQTKREGDQVSVSQSIEGVLGSAAAGTAFFHVVLPGLGRTLDRAFKQIKLGVTESQLAQGIRKLVASHELGAAVDATPQGSETAQRVGGSVQPGTVADPYTFSPVEHPSDRVWYAASEGTGEHIPLDDLGEGIYGTDRGQVANNLSDGQGKVHEFRVSEKAKFLNLEQSAETPEGKEFVKEFAAKAGVKPEGDTVNAVIQNAQGFLEEHQGAGAAWPVAKELAQKMGYDGVHYVSEAGGDKTNRVLLFPGSDGEHTASYDGNPETVPRASSDEQLAGANSKENSPLATPEIDQSIQKFGSEKPPVHEIPPEIQEMNQRAQDLLKDESVRALLPEEEIAMLEKEIEDLKREKATDKQTESLAKEMANCMTSGVT